MTDFAALVAELKDAALDAGATWDRCSDEFQKKLETRLHDAERALLAAVPAAKGGTEDWRDDPSADERWNAGLDFGMQQLCAKLGVDPQDVSWDAATETVDGDVRSVIGNILTQWAGDEWQDAPTRLASPPPPARAAGGGLGDLAALSAGAKVGPKQIARALRETDWSGVSIGDKAILLLAVEALSAPTPDLGAQGEPVATVVWYDPEAHFGEKKPHKIIDASLAFLDSAPLGTKLYDRPAPTPDLGAQGEPVAHKIIEAADCIGVRGAEWALTIEWLDGVETVEHVSNHAARALGYHPDEEDDEAPAAPRTGSGVSVEERETLAWVAQQLAGRGQTEAAKVVSKALAIFAQAPRDGGETQGGSNTEAGR